MHPSLISANELQARLGKNTVIIDCRFNLTNKTQGQLQYREGHIPGAYYADLEQDLSAPVETHGGRHPLPDVEKLQEKLRRFGINDQTTVVVYDDSRLAYASRAWWLFKWMGLKDVRILNGGFSAWVAHQGAIDRREPPKKLGNFTAQIQPDQIVRRHDILEQSSLCIIDSREPRRFQGIEEPIDPIAGHIPDAINFFWQDVVDEKGFVKPIDWQTSHWKPIANNQEIVAYCGSGVTACVNIFSMHLCDINAKLYPGSWSDWCSYLEKARQEA